MTAVPIAGTHVVPRGRSLLFAAAAVVAFTSGPVAGQQGAARLDSIPLGEFSFRHPMTVIAAEELAVVRQRIAENIEPQASAFARLLRDAEAAQAFQPDPPATMHIMGGYEPDSNLGRMRAWLWRNNHAAYASGLAWACTGERKYADQAVKVLNAWSTTGTTFTGGDRGLQLGSFFSGMLYAADLIHDYDGWAPADRERFKTWWRDHCLVHTREVLRRRDNNWKDAGLLGVLAAAVVLEDRELLQEGLSELDSYFRERFDEDVRNKGVWKIRKDERGVYLPREVTRNDGRSGLTYTAYSLTTMVQALEIARYAGFDCWHRQTPEGATMQQLVETYFRWDVQQAPFPWHDRPARTDHRRNAYEIANNHFDLPREIVEWLEKNRPVNGSQGDEYVTLTKGRMPVRKE